MNKATKKDMNKRIDYQIKKIESGDYVLSSVVETGFGGLAINFIASGSLEVCESIMRKLTKKGS